MKPILPYNTAKQRLVIYKKALEFYKTLGKGYCLQGICIVIGDITHKRYGYSPWIGWNTIVDYFPELDWYECPKWFTKDDDSRFQRIDLLKGVIKKLEKQLKPKKHVTKK